MTKNKWWKGTSMEDEEVILDLSRITCMERTNTLVATDDDDDEDSFDIKRELIAVTNIHLKKGRVICVLETPSEILKAIQEYERG